MQLHRWCLLTASSISIFRFDIFNVLGGNWDPTDKEFSSVNQVYDAPSWGITCYSSHATHHMLRHHIIICIWDARAGCVFRFVVKIMSNIAAARFQHASADCHSYLSVDTCVFDTSSVLMRQIAVSWLVDASGAGAILSVGLFRHPKLKWAKMEKLFNVDGGVSGGTILSCTLLSFHRQPY